MAIMGLLKYIWVEYFCDLRLISQILTFPFWAVFSIISIPIIWLELIIFDLIIIFGLYVAGNSIQDFYSFCWEE